MVLVVELTHGRALQGLPKYQLFVSVAVLAIIAKLIIVDKAEVDLVGKIIFQ
jgi:hypothetical protein